MDPRADRARPAVDVELVRVGEVEGAVERQRAVERAQRAGPLGRRRAVAGRVLEVASHLLYATPHLRARPEVLAIGREGHARHHHEMCVSARRMERPQRAGDERQQSEQHGELGGAGKRAAC